MKDSGDPLTKSALGKIDQLFWLGSYTSLRLVQFRMKCLRAYGDSPRRLTDCVDARVQ